MSSLSSNVTQLKPPPKNKISIFSYNQLEIWIRRLAEEGTIYKGMQDIATPAIANTTPHPEASWQVANKGDLRPLCLHAINRTIVSENCQVCV